MALCKPYKRIYRQSISSKDDYLTDFSYAYDRLSYIHSYYLIEKDIKVLFDFISPNEKNEATFSHRIYELFFRCCTEFENNAIAILKSNGYSSASNMNIHDYFKINTALGLNHYEVRLNVWENGRLILKPFEEWDSSTFIPLSWYRDYNKVKHNRSQDFPLANFKNLLASAAGLLIILYAQYAYHSFSPYNVIDMVNDNDHFVSANDSLFEIKPFEWPDAEKYDFDWSVLKHDPYAFETFNF